MHRKSSVLVAACLALGGCASTAPVLYPNAYYQSVGREVAQRDIDACMQLAEAAGARAQGGAGEDAFANTATGATVGAASGAVGGAIVGSAGRGAAVGAATGATAGFLGWIFSQPKHSTAFENFVNQCLEERGYQPVGWN